MKSLENENAASPQSVEFYRRTGSHNTAIGLLVSEGSLKGIMASLLEINQRREDLACFTRTYLIDSVEAEMRKYDLLGEGPQGRHKFEAYLKLFRELDRRDVPHTPDTPNFSELSIYARLGLEHQVLQTVTYSSRINAEAKAVACELLQVAMFDSDICRRRSKTSGILPGQKLDHFRTAQRVRNTAGIKRPDAPGKCFMSLDDVAALEKQLKQGHVTEFLAQCCLLGLVDSRHFRTMFAEIRKHSELTEFYVNASPGLGNLGDDSGAFHSQFCQRFETLTASTPTWKDTLLYIKLSREMSLIWDVRNFGVDTIPADVLNSFLNYVLMYILRAICDANWPEEGSLNWVYVQQQRARTEVAAAVMNIKLLLQRGASLKFTNTERLQTSRELARKYSGLVADDALPCQERLECRSSVTLLLRIARRVPSFNIPWLQRHLCCHADDGSGSIKFRQTEPAPLSCLAARACRPPGEYPRIPQCLITKIDFHRELAGLSRGVAKITE